MLTRHQNKIAALIAALCLLGPSLAAAQPAPATGATARPAPSLPPLQLSPQPQLPSRIPGALAASGPIKIITSLDKAVIRVGDLVHYSLVIQAPPGSRIMMPPPGAQLGEFLIRDYSFPELEKKETTAMDRVRAWLEKVTGAPLTPAGKGQELHFTITAYDTGDLVIPPLPVIVIDPAGQEHDLRAESARVRVAPVTNPEDLTIRDVKPPVAIELPVKKYLPWLLIPAFLLAAAIAVFIALRRRRREEEAPLPLRPAHELAFEELDALEQAMLSASEYEQYYTRLSRIMRKYLALRFLMYALEYTTSEIAGRLKDRDIEHGDYDKTRRFLEEADRVKFARYAPRPEERSTAIARCREIVQNTMEKPPAVEQKEAA
ncbi:MAG TPA: hypothetical protein VM658_19135 [bacterium]|nr:hypothetical protein [bacterium]